MKKLLSILLLSASLGAMAQTYDQLPSGSKPYGNQLYLSPAGLIIGGTQATKFRVIGSKKYVDSLLVLKAPISPSGGYIQSSPSTSQNASISVLGNIYSETGFQTAAYGFKNGGSAFFGPTRTGDLSIAYGNNFGTLRSQNLTADREYQLPDSSGTIALKSQLTTLERLANKGQVNGYASLDASGKVPLTQVNDVLLGAVNYQGNYNASNNTPALPAATGNKGKYYVVTNSGTQQNLDFNSGDWIISNGNIWEKVDNNNKVASVNGRIGAVSGLAEQNYVDALGINTGTLLINSITGNSASTNLWRGLDAQFDNGYATDSAPAWLVGVEASTSKARPFTAGQIATMIGIPAGGETLQSVTARNSETTNPILISNNLLWNRSQTADVGTIISGNTIQTSNYANNAFKPLLVNVGGGNVGIGNTDPQSKLDVTGDISLSNNLLFKGIGNTGLTFVNAGNTNAITSNNYGLDFYTGINQYVKRLRVDANGAQLKGRLDVSGAPDAFRIINNAGYLSFYNDAYDTRTGYLQSNFSLGNLTLQSEAGNRTIQLNYSGGNVVLGDIADDLNSKLQVKGAIKAVDSGNVDRYSTIDPYAVTVNFDGKFSRISTGGFVFGDSNAGKAYSVNVASSGSANFQEGKTGTVAFTTDVDTKANLVGVNNFTGGAMNIGGQVTIANPYGLQSASVVTGNLRTSNIVVESPSTVSGTTWEIVARSSGSGELGRTSVSSSNIQLRDNISATLDASTTKYPSNAAITTYVNSGAYTPILSVIIGSPTSLSATPAHYTKVGNEVTVTGFVTAQINTATNNTGISISLPIASNFTTQEDLAGIGSTTNTNYPVAVTVSADASNDYANLLIGAFPVQGSATKFGYSFTYTIKQ